MARRRNQNARKATEEMYDMVCLADTVSKHMPAGMRE